MSSGVGMPFSLTGGASMKVSCGRVDFKRVVSSHVRPSGNFVIKRAAMLTLSPMTNKENHKYTCRTRTCTCILHVYICMYARTSVFVSLLMSHYSTESDTSCHTNRIMTNNNNNYYYCVAIVMIIFTLI